MNEKDIKTIINWGIKLYPCIIKRDANGNKLPVLFPKDMGVTKEWKFWAESAQLPAVELMEYISNGYGLAGVLSELVAILDCDNNESYSFVSDLLVSQGVRRVAEKSLSYRDTNGKYHFYFKSSKLPYCTKFKDINLPGSGELLGSGHLVYFNIKGWLIPPGEYNILPDLPDIFYPVKKTSNVKSLEPYESTAIQEGERNTRLVSIAGSLRRQGLDAVTIYHCLKQITCEPPLKDIEIKSIAKSIGQYSIGNEKIRELKEKLENIKKEQNND